MNKVELEEEISKILIANAGEGYYFSSVESIQIEIDAKSDGTIEVSISEMYRSPPFNSAIIFALCELFGTKKIDEDRFSFGGCDTCDWGSSYGYNLTIKESTLVIEE